MTIIHQKHFLLMACVAISVVRGSHLTSLARRGKYGALGLPHELKNNLHFDQWFTQKLNHFDPTSRDVFPQRYLENSTYYKEGGPIFLMISGEGEMSGEWLLKGNWINYAKKYKAQLFMLEHRYYGKSHPTSDLSVENLRYLSSEQALADIANFINGITASYHFRPGTKWIVFGGSYAGNLAAWARLKYPHLIHSAMSASAPVYAKVDFYEYVDAVRDSLATYDANCPLEIKKANEILVKRLKTKSGQDEITNQFRLCETIDSTNPRDVYNLLEILADNIAGVVQYNKDNRWFRSAAWKITIDTVCDIMLNESLGNSDQRYAAVNSLLLDAYEKSCLNFTYDNLIETLKNVSWDSESSASGERQWMYQTCTEFGYYQTSESKNQLYDDEFPLQFFLQQCIDIFGDSFTRDTVFEAVNRTNIMYGGLDCKATRVVYVHGTIDPWHVLGITETKKEASPAILINGTAHCANMYPPADTDLPALKAARAQVDKLIGKWLRDP